MSNSNAGEIGLLCPDRTWIRLQELLQNAEMFGKGSRGLTDAAASENQFMLSAGTDENKLQLYSLGLSRAFLPDVLMLSVSSPECLILHTMLSAQHFFLTILFCAALVVSSAHDESVTILEEGDVSKCHLMCFTMFAFKAPLFALKAFTAHVLT